MNAQHSYAPAGAAGGEQWVCTCGTTWENAQSVVGHHRLWLKERGRRDPGAAELAREAARAELAPMLEEYRRAAVREFAGLLAAEYEEAGSAALAKFNASTQPVDRLEHVTRANDLKEFARVLRARGEAGR